MHHKMTMSAVRCFAAAGLLVVLFFRPAFAESDQALDFCREKIDLEKETFQLALEESQRALDRYLAYVKKQENRVWSGSSVENKQKILDDFDFFQKPIDDLKKTEFTQEADCLDAVAAQRWATRALIVNKTGYRQGKITMQQIVPNWESDTFDALRSTVEATEVYTDAICVYVTYDKQAIATSCSSRLHVFSESPEGRAQSKSIVRELRYHFPKSALITE